MIYIQSFDKSLKINWVNGNFSQTSTSRSVEGK